MMGAVVPYALSVHSFVTKVGSYAGFAAIIGVALLVLMVFVNAREASALRDRAEDAEDRLEQLQHRVEQASRAAAAQPPAAPPGTASVRTAPVRTAPAPAAAIRAAAAPAGMAPAGRSVAAPARGASPSAGGTAVIPAAPVGVGAPALSSATRLIPIAAPEDIARGPAGSPATAEPAANGAAPGLAPTSVPVAPAPSTAAAAGAGGSRPAPAPGIPPAPPRTTRRDYGRAAGDGPRFGRVTLLVAGVLVAAIVVAVVLVLVIHRSPASSSASRAAATRRRASATTTTASASKTVRIVPSHVTVAVLNATSTTNLAHDVSTKLSTAGYRQGSTGNFPDQTLTTTAIGYLPGFRPEGLAVAKSLSVSSRTVAPVAATARDVACSSTTTSCPDQVIVIVGADLSSLAS